MSQGLSKTHGDKGVARIDGGECHDHYMEIFLQTLGMHPSVKWPRNSLDLCLEFSRIRYL